MAERTRDGKRVWYIQKQKKMSSRQQMSRNGNPFRRGRKHLDLVLESNSKKYSEWKSEMEKWRL